MRNVYLFSSFRKSPLIVVLATPLRWWWSS